MKVPHTIYTLSLFLQINYNQENRDLKCTTCRYLDSKEKEDFLRILDQ